MKLTCGIIGFPNIGKSTLFNIISNSEVLSKNYPFCTIEPNYGMTNVIDKRLFELNNLIQSIKVVPSKIKIVDIAGLIRGSHKGEGLGNKFLSHIRETNVIIHMIRSFKDIKVVHTEGSINPIRDKEIIDMELQLKDLETIEKKLRKIEKINHDQSCRKILLNVVSFLKKGKNIRTYPFKDNEKKYINNLQLLTMKPVLYVCNYDKEEYSNIKDLKKIVSQEKSPLIVLSLNKKRKDLTYEVYNIIQESFNLLTLQSFFTIGKQEIRSWSIPKDWTVYQASSIIHTDFKKGFVCAEVIHYKDFIKYGSEEKVKKAGKKFLAGKNYLVQDGDILNFRFNK
ncbi:redox-regulated ATPase YchF [Blattabacterium cuenoti]|uniref:redox-regulated ATPase YchF n=1 Tax=Blattabacterium cuenoti TaxID=1653831 RepID=UPI00163BA357|nr:DUF933 domain-containing protein [Blattabacterium cuenoti]